MRYRQMIILPGRVNNEIFNLPCVRSIEKFDDKPLYRFNEKITSQRGTSVHSLRPGEIIAEDYSGKWWWLTQSDYQKWLNDAKDLADLNDPIAPNRQEAKKSQIKNLLEQAQKEGKPIDWATVVLC